MQPPVPFGFGGQHAQARDLVLHAQEVGEGFGVRRQLVDQDLHDAAGPAQVLAEGDGDREGEPPRGVPGRPGAYVVGRPVGHVLGSGAGLRGPQERGGAAGRARVGPGDDHVGAGDGGQFLQQG
ncbi:hypothetical protein SF23_15700 [Streptomyces sp. MBRL 10]|nr:hypothetical protein SF23_15700 [Streptomyces sp. MBRL 10]